MATKSPAMQTPDFDFMKKLLAVYIIPGIQGVLTGAGCGALCGYSIGVIVAVLVAFLIVTAAVWQKQISEQENI